MIERECCREYLAFVDLCQTPNVYLSNFEKHAVHFLDWCKISGSFFNYEKTITIA